LVGLSAGYADGRASGKGGADDAAQARSRNDEQIKPTAGNAGMSAHVGLDDAIVEVMAHPAFAGFGRFLFPLNTGGVVPGLTLAEVGRLLPYHGHVDPAMTIKVLNHMIDRVHEGKKIFFDIYTPQQRSADSSLESTGLFRFQGRTGAPFAVICPGGGFSYVGSIHEGFPYALELSQRGLNAFVLHYRRGGEQTATRDLAAAVSFILENASTLEVSTTGYSLWGSSAGARMVANIGSFGLRRFGGRGHPGPSAVIMAYTARAEYSGQDPPTFVVVSEDDRIVDVATVQRRVEGLRGSGVKVEFHKFRHAGHGFGIGTGTDAAGWIEDAVRFWQKHTTR
jgi:acetyl esterase/lipase